MEALPIIGSIASIVSLLVSLFIAVKVIQIQTQTVKGDGNVLSGRDTTITGNKHVRR